MLIIFGLMSCSKLLDNNDVQVSVSSLKEDDPVIFKRDPHVQDSLDKVFLAKYLDYTPLTSFEKDSIAKNQINEHVKGLTSLSYGEGPEYTDWSGLIHLKKFWAYNSELQHSHNVTTLDLPSDWVLVGGGAQTWGFDPDANGAFLTESRPTVNNNGWRGGSKDHAVTCMHALYVYAIGMKITGVDPEYLRSNIYYGKSNPSAPNNLPTASKVIPWNYHLTGGGAFDSNEGYGNMLIESYPQGILGGYQWIVKGKAHKRSAPSTIEAYAIGIKDISYPGVGYIRTSYTSTVESTPGWHDFGPLWCYCPPINGQALTCPGAIITYEGWGRMLMSLYPALDIPDSQTSSRDCYYVDGGSNFAYAIGIEKRPW
jgi:hypothetical protein